MIKKYKPNEVICIVNDEEIESLNPEDVEWRTFDIWKALPTNEFKNIVYFRSNE